MQLYRLAREEQCTATRMREAAKDRCCLQTQLAWDGAQDQATATAIQCGSTTVQQL